MHFIYIYINICPILIVVGNLSAWFVGYPVISHAKESKNVSNLKEKRSNQWQHKNMQKPTSAAY